MNAQIKTSNMYKMRGELAVHGAEELYSIVSYNEKVANVAVDLSKFSGAELAAAASLVNEIVAKFA